MNAHLHSSTFSIGLILSLGSIAITAEPAWRVVKADQTAIPLLRNAGFEENRDNQPEHWRPAPQGARWEMRQGRDGSAALVCDNPSGEGWFGLSQTLTLDRTNALPLRIRGWSKAQEVSGSADSDYALYVDIVYVDNTPLWGQTVKFPCGTHDWVRREGLILPEKPVKTLTLHCLFRRHAGKVWFDDVSVEEIAAQGPTMLFQGVPVVKGPEPPPTTGMTISGENADNLRLSLRNGVVNSFQLEGRELLSQNTAGFLARDVAANSDFFTFGLEDCPELQLTLNYSLVAGSNRFTIVGQVADTTGRDRAITLVFALPIHAMGWRWGDDLRRSRVITGSGEYVNQVSVGCGATGTLSVYPVGAVWNDQLGLALALDMAQPAQYRIGYHGGLDQWFIAFDFGLIKDSVRFPSRADFRFVLFRFDPQEGFRAAWQKYQQIFPDHFVVRARDQGLWMPFTDVGTVEGWQDFGFKFHEGNNRVPWDDEHGILSFRYTEPMTWWMPMPKGAPRTPTEALRIREEMSQSPRPDQRRMAEVTRRAAMYDEAGQPALLFRNEPWCDGAVWSLNPNPWLGQAAAEPQPSTAPLDLTNAATVHWNESLKERLYGPKAQGRLDGEYLDSLEGYVTADLNYRREHFRDTTVPLTFSTETYQPALFKGLAVFEFTRWISEEVHRLGGLTFANGVPYRYTFLCPWLDVLGTETDWLRNGRYQPAAIPQMDLWRTMSGAKPYLLLMNTDYDRFTPDLVEKYFHRCLFYGMWPGFFSHNAADNPYWRNPKWYNRDRPLFRKYLPLIQRVAEAGWQPLTGAASDHDQVLIERFGPDEKQRVYLTLYNASPEARAVNLSIRWTALGLDASLTPQALLPQQPLAKSDQGWKIPVPAEQTVVIQLSQ